MHMIQALIQAVINENVKTVKQLLQQGADPNGYEDADKIRPLHFVAQKKSDQALQIARLLIRAGADTLAETEPDKQTPLEIAKLMSCDAMVIILSAANKNQVWH